jgi:methionyl aminopeptidase
MNNGTLVNAIKSAKAHKNVGTYIRSLIKPGMSLKEIALLIENKIKEEINYDNSSPLSQGIAFPVGLSLNNCAAHYTPNYGEDTIILRDTDILKIDYGVHIKGTIIDSAFTLHFDPKYDEFVNISKDITNFAVKQCGPDTVLGDIGKEIEEFIDGIEIEIDNKIYPLTTMHDLSGHMISTYEIHAGKAVPNIAINYPLRMKDSEYYAIEPFISTGKGETIISEPNSHYMLNKDHALRSKNLNNDTKNIYDIILNNYYTLPFCQRWLYEYDSKIDYNSALVKLERSSILKSYPPLYDIENSIISQFEHTIYVKENGIINLTKNDFY